MSILVMWNICIITFILGNVFSVETAISNLALHKPTQQISTLHGGSSERAVDGNKDGNYEALSCTHTKVGSGNWWMVDLESTNVIYEVRIHNRLTYGHRLVDLNILVGGTQDNWKLCDYYAGPGGAGEEVIIKCLQPLTGRYVKIQKVDDTDFLHFCEVEVMGRAGAQGIYSFTHGKQSNPRPDQMISLDVKDEFQCALLCTKNPDCEHFNFKDQGSSKVCQLLLYMFDGTLNEDASVTHYSLQ